MKKIMMGSLLLVFFAQTAATQPFVRMPKKQTRRNFTDRVSIVAEPLNYLRRYNSIDIGVDYRFSPAFSVYGQVGFGNSLMKPINMYDEIYNRFRVKGELRWYYKAKKEVVIIRCPTKDTEEVNNYLSVEYNQLIRKFWHSGMVGQECIEPRLCSYSSFTDFTIRDNITMLLLKRGSLIYYANGRLFIDMYVGLGIGVWNKKTSVEGWFTEVNHASLAYASRWGIGRFRPQLVRNWRNFGITGTAGIRIGYTLSSKR